MGRPRRRTSCSSSTACASARRRWRPAPTRSSRCPAGSARARSCSRSGRSGYLRLHAKPVVLLDPDGHWTACSAWVRDLAAQGFVGAGALRRLVVTTDVRRRAGRLRRRRFATIDGERFGTRDARAGPGAGDGDRQPHARLVLRPRRHVRRRRRDGPGRRGGGRGRRHHRHRRGEGGPGRRRRPRRGDPPRGAVRRRGARPPPRRRDQRGHVARRGRPGRRRRGRRPAQRHVGGRRSRAGRGGRGARRRHRLLAHRRRGAPQAPAPGALRRRGGRRDRRGHRRRPSACVARGVPREGILDRPDPRLRQEHLPRPGPAAPLRPAGGHRLAGADGVVEQGLHRRDARRRRRSPTGWRAPSRRPRSPPRRAPACSGPTRWRPPDVPWTWSRRSSGTRPPARTVRALA